MPRKEFTVEAINQRLRKAAIGVQVRQKGHRLYLRATLPPKPGAKNQKRHQQEISLQIYANPAGLERAEAEARKLGASLACREFDWSIYQAESASAEGLTTQQWIERFRVHYCRTHTLTERTWQKHWNNIYKRLPLDELLSADALLAVVLSTEQDSRVRKQACQKLQKLADFAHIDINLKPYQGSYSPGKAKPRDLPTDDAIAEHRDRIEYVPWQWVYGMLAAYGLRPHEAFFCQFVEDDPTFALQVLEGKTGARIVYPLYAEWVDRWHLWEIQRPQVKLAASVADVYEEYGRRACRQFTRYSIPFPPYDLRHAYAIRASVVFEFPVATAAAYMGHSPMVHWNRYNRWISERQHAEIYQKRMGREDRPAAP